MDGRFASDQNNHWICDRKASVFYRKYRCEAAHASDKFSRWCCPFHPSPLQGLTLLISREGFLKTLSDQIGDSESLTAWTCEHIILNEINPEIHDRVGILVRHRQIPSLLNQADEEKDLLRSTSLLDGEGEIIDKTSLVEILLELVGKTGGKTLLLEKLVPLEDATTHARLMVADWNRMLKTVTMEHPEDIRLGPARPHSWICDGIFSRVQRRPLGPILKRNIYRCLGAQPLLRANNGR